MRLAMCSMVSAVFAISPVVAGTAARTVSAQERSGPESQGQASAPAIGSQIEQENERRVTLILERLGPRQHEPASEVFQNVRLPWMRNTPAEVFLAIMNIGYARALGVACTHCHVEADFASDDKRPKRAAREMAVMHRRINQELAKMKSLRGTPDERAINCAACHRGTLDPNTAR